MSELKKFYDEFGYAVLKSEIPKDQIQDYRRKILAFFHSNPHERQMTPTSILQYFQEIYDIQTKPLVDFYQGENLLRKIDGIGNLVEITKRIENIL